MKLPELSAVYYQPLFDLISQSRAVHLRHWRGEEVQRCSLLSIKTGSCSEDCAYCAQSAHYSTGIEREDLLSLEDVMSTARQARSQGATRFCMTQKQVQQILAINDLTDTHTLAHLLKWDSVHGKFDGEIGYDDENIVVRGHKIRILKDRDPANLPWKKLDIDVVLESTGFFTSRDKAELHLKAGAKRVLISAPAKNPDVTICIGVNDDVFDPAKDKIVSNASCTTNCLAPLAKVLHGHRGCPVTWVPIAEQLSVSILCRERL